MSDVAVSRTVTGGSANYVEAIAMRLAEVVAGLRAQIAERTHRTWEDYSDGLWAGIRS